MFDRILIANRGEIACRVIRTARRLGVETIAVYSEADRDALHVEMADEAYPIGRAPARDSYLNVAAILDAARQGRAEAIHPGYGFLSENADFAQAVADAGLVFIGPPPAAIRAMGSKSAAKALMQKAGIPLVPGYHGDDQDPARLAAEAARIGYPVLIKASAGGGGKGMRAVHDPAEFAEALALARGEASSAFGDDRVLIERYLTRPRHIEIQVFADRYGNVVHLFERDCSIQRRHQKVIEESPAPGLEPDERDTMGRAACNAARAVGYEGAGTVEFIVEDGEFYFMEMNTRLQVEHPVTEMVTGEDLVEWQLRIAGGEPLPKPQTALRLDGHAIEARIYAEDPAHDYRPSTGRLFHLREPQTNARVRIDTGVREGDSITVHYDPMIAKLIVWGRSRDEAVGGLWRAITAYEVAGVDTNLALLRAIAEHPDYDAGKLDTLFLTRNPALAEPAAPDHRSPVTDHRIAAAVAETLARRAAAARETAARRGDRHSPWAQTNAWRLNGDGYQDLAFRQGEATIRIRAYPLPDGTVRLEQDGHTALMRRDGDRVDLDGVKRQASAAGEGPDLWIFLDGAPCHLVLIDPLDPPVAESAADRRLLSPMPGRIVRLETQPGATVRKGDILLVLEAMKVQMRLPAPRDATVAAIRVAEGDVIEEGIELVVFEEPPAETIS